MRDAALPRCCVAAMTGWVEVQKTPLQMKLELLGRQPGIAAIVIAAALVVVGALTGREWFEMMSDGELRNALAVGAIFARRA